MIEARLAAGGYVNYETSAFAQPGRECRHNLNTGVSATTSA